MITPRRIMAAAFDGKRGSVDYRLTSLEYKP